MCSTRSANSLLDAALHVLWAQWTELGVAGVAGTQSSVVDPEALVLATVQFGRYEPRLFDEALDWLASGSGSLDVTRLRRLAALSTAVDARVLGALMEFMRKQSATAKWDGSVQQMLAREDAAGYGAAIPLFVDASGEALPTLGEKDALFLEYGIDKPRTVLRGLSQPPSPRKPTLARLRLRDLVGAGVRAEVLLYLATHDSAHGRLIAARSGFAQRQVSEYLAQLGDAGFAEKWGEGRTIQYRLDPSFGEVLGRLPAYVDWPRVWELVSTIWRTCQSAEQATSYAWSKRWREVLGVVKDMPSVEGMAIRVPSPEDHPGELILDHADEYLERVATALKALA